MQLVGGGRREVKGKTAAIETKSGENYPEDNHIVPFQYTNELESDI